MIPSDYIYIREVEVTLGNTYVAMVWGDHNQKEHTCNAEERHKILPQIVFQYEGRTPEDAVEMLRSKVSNLCIKPKPINTSQRKTKTAKQMGIA